MIGKPANLKNRLAPSVDFVFSSQLRRAIERVPMRIDGQAASQWLGWINANASKFGVKAEEVEWSGLGEWLDLQGHGRLTRSQVLGYLGGHCVKLERVVLSGDPSYADWLGQKLGIASSEAQDAWQYDDDDIHAEFARETGRPHFDGYRQDGGENYREILIRIEDQDVPEPFARDLNPAMLMPYRSPHWRYTNVICHIRISDRRDDAGRAVLFVEEIQSDWAQAGRKHGFAGKGAQEDATLRDGRSPGPVVRGPFVEKTQSWVTLALKQVVGLAVAQGYERIAFVRGEQCSSTFRLVQKIGSLAYKKDCAGGYYIVAGGAGGGVTSGAKTLEELEVLLGPRAAEHIASFATNDIQYLEDLDATIGGEGMGGFYDQLVPQLAAKLLKKIGGDGLETVVLDGRGDMRQVGFAVTPRMRQAVREGLPLFSRVQPSGAGSVFREDIPNERWLQEKVEYAREKGVNRWGVPYMGVVTGYFREPVQLPLEILVQLKGARQEQQNVRVDSLDYIRSNWDEVSQYAPFITVSYDGQAWISEGNHRIMIAAEKALEHMAVEVRFFDGGQRAAGPLRHLVEADCASDSQGEYLRERAR